MFPGSVFIAVVIKLTGHLAFFWYYLRRADLSVFHEDNFKRFLVYNICGGLGTAQYIKHAGEQIHPVRRVRVY